MANEAESRANIDGGSDEGSPGTGPDTTESVSAPAEGEGLAPEQPWTRICPKCSVQNSIPGDYCPNCGASYNRKRTRLSKKTMAIILALVLVLGAGTAIALSVQHSQEVAAQEEADRKASEAAEKAAAEQKKLQEAAEAKAEAQRALRALIVDGLEEAVQKDATERVDAGRLDGPIQRTECTPLGGGSVDDLTAITGTFECIAVNEKKENGSESGYVFSATVNWDAASYSWHLGR
ncbi:hypothetical protein N2K95_03340 [Arthrobacter zhaoxinii]|uniref:RanBP2-type domain-containing protein n=1 Tax=Arthrobacter zhaoxinii TaxID=2964616 RepID=A0ABY5YRJ7_9MICC|nr:hypothetical protein [Arthrobacter zhaoxinii]UWX97731.1 hypothetical protein N2K95_03340 [Arthrobacter zhaoxinii]